MAGCVGSVLREDVERTDVAAAEYLVHARLARSMLCTGWPEPLVLCRAALLGFSGC